MDHCIYLTEEEIEAPRGGLTLYEGNVGGRAQQFRGWIVWLMGQVPGATWPFLSCLGPQNPSPASCSPPLQEPSVAHAVCTLHIAPGYNFLYLYLSFACHQAVDHHAATNPLYVLNIICVSGYMCCAFPVIFMQLL